MEDAPSSSSSLLLATLHLCLMLSAFPSSLGTRRLRGLERISCVLQMVLHVMLLWTTTRMTGLVTEMQVMGILEMVAEAAAGLSGLRSFISGMDVVPSRLLGIVRGVMMLRLQAGLAQEDRVVLVLIVICLGLEVVLGVGFFPEGEILGSDKEDGKSAKRSVVILAIGTRGDVQPFVSLGFALKKEHPEYRVRICAFRAFRSLVEQYGLEFHDVGIEELDQQGEKWVDATHVSQVMTELLSRFAFYYSVVGTSFYNACQETNVDLIIATSITLSFGLTLSEKLKRPCWVVKFSPDMPTREFPPAGSSTRKFGLFDMFGLLNLLRWYYHWLRIGIAAHLSSLGKAENEFRVNDLGLQPLNGGKRLQEMGNVQTICAYSRTMIPKPRDYPSNVFTTGCWFADGNKTATSKELDNFLFVDNGSRIQTITLCITFGSMSNPADLFLTIENVIVAAHCFFFSSDSRRRISNSRLGSTAGVETDRVENGVKLKILLIKTGEMPLTLRKIIEDYKADIEFFVVGDVPHELVFPKSSCIIHHGGAGTTARAVQFGVPSIIIPILEWTDQPFWAQQLERLGVGVHVRRHRNRGFNAGFQEKIVNALELVCGTGNTSSRIRENVQRLSTDFEKDGVMNAVKLIERAIT